MRAVAAILACVTLFAAGAEAQPARQYQRACAAMAQDFFRDRQARADMRYNGARADGTETVGGEIFLETRSAYVACAFAPGSGRMVEFFVDGQDRTRFATHGHGASGGGHGPGSGAPGFFRVAGVPPGDVLNLRAGPSARDPIVGALANGDRVRNLGCRDGNRGRWCRVGLLDEMGGTGWANARYLVAAGGGGHGARPPAAGPGPGGTDTVRLRFPPDQSGTALAAALPPGASTRYLLRARSGQTLHVRVASRGPEPDYQIFNPDGTFLLEMLPARTEYRGQLWQSGEHVIEVINRTRRRADYELIVTVR